MRDRRWGFGGTACLVLLLASCGGGGGGGGGNGGGDPEEDSSEDSVDSSTPDPAGLNTDEALDSSDLQIASVERNESNNVIATLKHRESSDLLVVTGKRDESGEVSSISDASLRVTDEEGTERTGRFTFNTEGLPQSMTFEDVVIEFDDYTDSDVRLTVYDSDGDQVGDSARMPLDESDLKDIRSLQSTLYGSGDGAVTNATSRSTIQASQAASLIGMGVNIGSCAVSGAVSFGLIGSGVGAIAGVGVGAYAAASCTSAALSIAANIGTATGLTNDSLSNLSLAVDGAICSASGSTDWLACGAYAADVASTGLRADPDATILEPSGDTTIAVGEPVQFYGVGAIQYADIDAYEWRFGAGETSNEDVTTHTFGSAGVYEAKFKVMYEDRTAVTDQVEITVDPGIAAPAIDSVTGGANELEIRWSDVDRAAGYNLYYSTVVGTADSGTIERDVTSPHRLTGLDNGTTYYIVVRAFDSAGVESDPSEERSGIPSTGTSDDGTDPATSLSETFNDGNFTENPSWSSFTDDEVAGTVAVENGELHIVRTGAGGNGGRTGIELPMDYALTEDTALLLDARPVSRSVADGCGFKCGEYPVSLELVLEDSDGEELTLVYGVNYGSAIADKTFSSTKKQRAVSVPQDRWTRDLGLRPLDVWPEARRIKKIVVEGAGWNYESYVDNVRVEEVSGSLPTTETDSSSDDGRMDTVYREDFESDAGYTSEISDNASGDCETERESGNYYVKTRDQSGEWYCGGRSPGFGPVDASNDFKLEVRFNPVKPDWGNYPGLRFFKNEGGTPREDYRASAERGSGFSLANRWSDGTNNKFVLRSTENAADERYKSPTIPASDEWYSIKLDYDASAGDISWSINREDGSVFHEEENVPFTLSGSFDRIYVGDVQGGTLYGDTAEIRVDDIRLMESQ